MVVGIAIHTRIISKGRRQRANIARFMVRLFYGERGGETR